MSKKSKMKDATPIQEIQQVEDPLAVKQQTIPAYMVKELISKLPDDAGVRFVTGGVVIKNPAEMRQEGAQEIASDPERHYMGEDEIVVDERNGMTPSYTVPSEGRHIPMENIMSLDLHKLPVCQRNSKEMEWEQEHLSHPYRDMIDEFRCHDINVANYCGEMVRRSILAANEYNTQKFAHMAGTIQDHVSAGVRYMEDLVDTVRKGE